jgi:uncharacterized membrane protein (GlpM family)
MSPRARDAAVVVGLALLFMSSYFWIRSSAFATPASIAHMVVTEPVDNPSLARDLCAQEADSLVAFFYLVLGFGFQAAVNLAPSAAPSNARWTCRAAVLAVSLAFLYFAGAAASDAARVRLERGVDAELERLLPGKLVRKLED